MQKLGYRLEDLRIGDPLLEEAEFSMYHPTQSALGAREYPTPGESSEPSSENDHSFLSTTDV